MNVVGALGTALNIVAILLALAALYAIWVIITTVRDLLEAVEEVRARVVPLLEKEDLTLDAVNAELLRVDAIVSQAEEVTDAVSTASGFIRSPINSAALGIARLVRRFRHSRRTEGVSLEEEE